MKEVKLGRVAGPFKKNELPFDYFVQSPIGLVPKHGGKTRLIFHLSFKFKNGNPSINECTPPEKCTVKYCDLDMAIKQCSRFNGRVFWAKTDVQSAFRLVPLKIQDRNLLCMQAKNPETGQPCFFVENCLPFSHSISCSHFQRFSNCLTHIMEKITGCNRQITNYLDDYLAISSTKEGCNKLVSDFIRICDDIGVLIAMDKTEWGWRRITFLGILLDGYHLCMSMPEDKKIKAQDMVRKFLSKRKATVKEIQSLAGTLNFLCKAIHPGRPFIRRMYAKYAYLITKGEEHILKPHHHVQLDHEFKNDCQIWDLFLSNPNAVLLPLLGY